MRTQVDISYGAIANPLGLQMPKKLIMNFLYGRELHLRSNSSLEHNLLVGRICCTVLGLILTFIEIANY